MRNAGYSVVLLVLLTLQSLANRQGDALVRQINALKSPKWVEAKAVDPSYEAAWGKRYAVFLKKRNALIWKLYRVDPKHKKTADLLVERWMQFDDPPLKPPQMAGYIKRVDADINKVLANKPNPAIVEAALAAKAQNDLYAVFFDPTSEAKAIEGAQSYARRYPNGERLKDVMIAACLAVSEEAKPAAIRRFLEKFPDDPLSHRFVKTLRQAKSIGQPVELKFVDAMSGKEWDMAAHRGKVVLIDFWATWCGPCRETIPELKELYSEYHSKGFEIVGVSLDDSEAKGGLKKLREFVQKSKMPWPQYHQGDAFDGKFSSEWGVMSIPTTFLIDKQGNLRVVNEKKLKERIEGLLSEQG
ncbi:MAG: TlpA family protein disulfide reductase [Fimbriimonadaceae bacterium]|nr:TlpA family protein disulfide reductase [Fimbriimonadaceae bacterium]